MSQNMQSRTLKQYQLKGFCLKVNRLSCIRLRDFANQAKASYV